jgi:hypothetical protein
MFSTLLPFVPKTTFKSKNNDNPQCLPFANEFSIRTFSIWVWWIRVSTHKKTLKNMISFKRCKLCKKLKFHYVFSCYIYALLLVFKNEKHCSMHLGFFVFPCLRIKRFFCFHFCNLLASNVGDHTILNGDLICNLYPCWSIFGLCDPLSLLYCNQVELVCVIIFLVLNIFGWLQNAQQ